MDNATDAKNTCAECGELMSEGHSCSPATVGDPASGASDNSSTNGTEPTPAVEPDQVTEDASDEPRIEIPASLWASGLFKPAFARSAPIDQQPPAERGSRGSIFDPGYGTPAPEVEASSEPAAPVDAAPVDAAPVDEPVDEPPVEDTPISDEEPENPWAWAEPSTELATEPEAPTNGAVPTPEPAAEAATEPATELYDPFDFDAFEQSFAAADAYDNDPSEPDSDEVGDVTEADVQQADGLGTSEDNAENNAEDTSEDSTEESANGVEVGPVHDEYATVLTPVPTQREAQTIFDAADDAVDLTDGNTDDNADDDDDHDDNTGDDTGRNTGDTQVVPLTPAINLYGSSELPSAVPFEPAPAPKARRSPATDAESPAPVAADEPEEKKRRPALLIGALVLVLIAAAAGWWAWQRQQDSPVRTAFETSHDQFAAASSQLRAAGSIDQVALAGAEFEKAVPLLEKTSDQARERSSSYATSARRASLAELEVARAGAELTELSPTSLGAWRPARKALDEALTGLKDATPAIKDAGGSTEEMLTADTLQEIQQMIGDEIANSAEENTSDLLDRLGQARLVSDWRGIGNDASDLVQPMKTAATEFRTDPEKTADLASYRTFLSALGGLSSLRPAKLDGWEQVKERIENASRELPADADRAREVLQTADDRIVAARTKFAEWQTNNAAAKAEKQGGLEQLRTAREAIPEISEAYGQLSEELDAVIQRGATLPAEGAGGEAHQLLVAAADARDALRTRLAALSVPSGAASELAALTQVISDDAAAVRWASEAAEACIETCDITTRPGWNAMVEQAAGAGAAWEAAREAWAAAADETRAELRAITLPKRPKI